MVLMGAEVLLGGGGATATRGMNSYLFRDMGGGHYMH